MLRYLVAVLMAVTCFAADPALAIQLRMIAGDSDRGLTVEVTDDQGLPVNGANVTFQIEKGDAITSETHADGRASVAPAKFNHASGTFDVKITAVKDHARAGFVATQTFTEVPVAKVEAPKSEPVMPVTAAGGDGDFKASHSFHWKWLALLGLVAGAGAGLYLKAQANSTITISSPFLAAPQVGAPSITVGPH
jgi:hypothetical protein